MLEIILAIVGSGSLTGVVSWVFARRKNLAEAQQSEAEAAMSELDVVEKAIKIWREMSEQLKQELEQSRCLIGELKQQVDSMAEENQALRLEVAKLRTTNGKIVRALEKITPENFLHVVNELKQKLNDA